MQQPVDGFEGAGYLAELFVAIVISVVVLFFATLYRKLSHGSQQQDFKRGGYIWASLSVYVLSVICGFETSALALTSDFRQTAAMVIVGTLFALAALFLAIRAQGAGRMLAIISASFLTFLWIPMFLGRVVER